MIGGEENDGPAEQRELEDRARVVGDEDVRDEHQLVHLGMVGHVDDERICRRRPPAAYERMRPDEKDVILAQRPPQHPDIETPRITSLRGPVPTEGRRIEDDAPPVAQAISTADLIGDAAGAPGVHEHVGPGDAQLRHEEVDWLPERFGVGRRDRPRGDEAEVVVDVDREGRQSGLVGAEGLVREAVAELLEGAAGMPDLGNRRPRAWPNDIQRQEVVVDDDDAGPREVIAGDRGMPQHRDAAADAAGLGVGEDADANPRMATSEVVANGGEVAADRARVGRREQNLRRGLP